MTQAPDQDDLQSPVSLTDAIRESHLELPENEQPEALGAPIVPAEAPWEAPGWAARWKPEARDALGRWAKHPEGKSDYEPVQRQIEEMYGYTTRQQQEAAEYRKRMDPVYDVLRPYEQRYALQGIPIQQGVQQLFQAAELLNTDPDTAFPWLAGAYRPRNPVEAINRLAQSWGIDLNQALQEQPYIDPTVTALLSPLQQQVQQMQAVMQQQQQQQYQAQVGYVHQQQHALVSEISDFEVAKDDNGKLLHPHFAAVFDDMVKIVELGHAETVDDAYKIAVQYSPHTQTAQAQKARQDAIRQASARTAAAEKSERASRTVVGKSRSDAANLALSLKEGFDKAEAELGG